MDDIKKLKALIDDLGAGSALTPELERILRRAEMTFGPKANTPASTPTPRPFQKPHVILGNLDWNNIKQWGHIAKTKDGGRLIGWDLDVPQVGLACGRMGAGKTYTLGSFVEMYTTPIPGINQLPAEGCAVIFHYSRVKVHKAEFGKMNKPNTDPKQADLVREWGITPTGAQDLIVIRPPALVEEGKREVDVEVFPFMLHEEEVSVSSYLNLMGSADITSSGMEALLDTMEDLRSDLNPTRLLEAIKVNNLLSEDDRRFCIRKIQKAQRYINTSFRMRDLIKPGRIIVVDMRDEFLHESYAFRLLLCMIDLFQNVTGPNGKIFPKILVASEAHMYARDPFLVDALDRLTRLKRHLGMCLLIDSQDPDSLPLKVRELCDFIVALPFETEAWAHELARAKSQIKKIPVERYTELKVGESIIWTRAATDKAFMDTPQHCIMRPRASMHGGFTKTALG